MAEINTTNERLKEEIDSLLANYSLPQLLSSYGKTTIVGSYVYNLMAWRDFDLVLELDDYRVGTVYKLVHEIETKLNPDDMKVLNNINKENQNRPQGFWVGIYLAKWKIDLWIMDKVNADNELRKNKELADLLRGVDREGLLELKYELAQDPDYHVKFSSVDLYHAFVEANVRTKKQFFAWLELKDLA